MSVRYDTPSNFHAQILYVIGENCSSAYRYQKLFSLDRSFLLTRRIEKITLIELLD